MFLQSLFGSKTNACDFPIFLKIMMKVLSKHEFLIFVLKYIYIMNSETTVRLKGITTFIFDIDGVLTDSYLTFTKDDVIRRYNAKDGYAIGMAVKSGYRVAIISGAKEPSVRKRFEGLGIKDIYLSVGTADKPRVFAEYLEKEGLKAEEVLYIGDDIPDLLLMREFSIFSCCPADAVDEVLSEADYVTTKKGGEGAGREVVELVMKAQGKWMKQF